jgi:hypothetical protein
MHSRGGTVAALAAATLVVAVTSEAVASVGGTGAVAASEAAASEVALVGVTGAAAAGADRVWVTAAAGEAEGLAGVVHAGATAAGAIGAPIGADPNGVMVPGATDVPIDGSDIGVITAAIAFARFGRGGAGRKRG